MANFTPLIALQAGPTFNGGDAKHRAFAYDPGGVLSADAGSGGYDSVDLPTLTGSESGNVVMTFTSTTFPLATLFVLRPASGRAGVDVQFVNNIVGTTPQFNFNSMGNPIQMQVGDFAIASPRSEALGVNWSAPSFTDSQASVTFGTATVHVRDDGGTGVGGEIISASATGGTSVALSAPIANETRSTSNYSAALGLLVRELPRYLIDPMGTFTGFFGM